MLVCLEYSRVTTVILANSVMHVDAFLPLMDNFLNSVEFGLLWIFYAECDHDLISCY